MNSSGAYLVGVAFWLFLAASAVAAIVGEYKKRQAVMAAIRAAIEHGYELSPALIEKLVGREAESQGLEPEYLSLGGILTLAGGVGVAILAFFVRELWVPALSVGLGVAALAACVGIGLLIGANHVKRQRMSQARDRPT